MHLAAHELVLAADELDELARVDVRVTATLDVLDQLVRQRGQVLGRRRVRRHPVDGLQGRGELRQLAGEHLARGRGVAACGAEGRAVAVGPAGASPCGRGGVGVVVGDLDHDLVQDLDHVLELACREESAKCVGMDHGAEPGWFAHARRCCGLGILRAPSLRLCRCDGLFLSQNTDDEALELNVGDSPRIERA